MFKLIEKILSPKRLRLLTLMGLPGIGKSSLTANTLDYIAERKLLKAGSVYLNIRGVSCIEEFLKKFNHTLITENPSLFGSTKTMKSQSIATFTLILEKIQMVTEDFKASDERGPAILIVIDNAEDLIEENKFDFKMLIQMILNKIKKLKVLVTSRIRLTSTADLNEEIILLNNLNNQQSALMFKSLTREIPLREEKNLL